MTPSRNSATEFTKLIITPVGEYIAKMKECDPLTLTQMLGLPTEVDDSVNPNNNFVITSAPIIPTIHSKAKQTLCMHPSKPPNFKKGSSSLKWVTW